uniref:Sodium-dependent transporter n=1 Tax=Macrostomum lignano TaxID=282301 RepID=A0A1I8HGJ6_9PLAT
MAKDRQEESGAAEETEQKAFSSSAAIIFSCLGTVVGTGNIWRFPRIAAQNSATQGTLIFLATWIIFLFLWSSPMLLIEYAVGRYFKKSPIQSFRIAMGDKFLWCGSWVTMVTFMISCYYSVVLGWCLYYVFKSVQLSATIGLPSSEPESLAVFQEFAENSSWPILTHFLSILFAGACVIGGITWIEKANMVLVPTLLLIIVFTYCWSLLRDYSDYGVRFLFTPDIDALKDTRLWVDSASQNAFDTGAAMGLIVPYATYMTRKNGVVRFSMFIPTMNNFVSLLCALTIFSTVFSTLIQTQSTLSRTGIVEIIKQSGPASTGLTFIWIPVLFGQFGVFGSILCVLFFLCLSFAGVSSLIANIELTSLTLQDFGIPRKFGTPIVIGVTFIIGLPSAISVTILRNQDFVWGFALMISGIMFQLLVIKYGFRAFQNEVVNNYGTNDWPLTIVTMIIIVVVAPIEAIGLLVWWGYEIISSTSDAPTGERWFDYGVETFMTVVTEWLTLLILLLFVNVLVYYIRPAFMQTDNKVQQIDESENDGAFEMKHPGLYTREGANGQDNVAYANDK